MKIKRIRRGCYDKFHRCPGWAGGGMRYAKVQVCDGGSLPDVYEGWTRRVRFQFHPACGTLVLPYFTRYLDPTWHASNFRVWRMHREWEKQARLSALPKEKD